MFILKTWIIEPTPQKMILIMRVVNRWGAMYIIDPVNRLYLQCFSKWKISRAARNNLSWKNCCKAMTFGKKKYKISIWVIFFENENVLDLLPLFNPDINVVTSFLHPNENTFYMKDLPSLPLFLQNRHGYYILNSFVIKVPTMYKPLN